MEILTWLNGSKIMKVLQCSDLMELNVELTLYIFAMVNVLSTFSLGKALSMFLVSGRHW